jgi:hypothetical protein
MNHTLYRKLIKELCERLGFLQPDVLLNGGQLRIGLHLTSLVYDEKFDPGHVFVYVDLGLPPHDEPEVHQRLLRLNFDLAAGARGVMSLHPENDHVLYAFRYPLNESSSSRELLNMLTLFINEAPFERETPRGAGSGVRASSQSALMGRLGRG